jgi:hypothetical protein
MKIKDNKSLVVASVSAHTWVFKDKTLKEY